MNSWIDLSKIPQYYLKDKRVYDWKNSIGISCDFICEGITGVLIIVDYDSKKHKLSILYNNEVKQIDTDTFKAGRIMKLIGIRILTEQLILMES